MNGCHHYFSSEQRSDRVWHEVRVRSLIYPSCEEIVRSLFKEEDILHLLISEEPESASVEISPNITAELNADLFELLIDGGKRESG